MNNILINSAIDCVFEIIKDRNKCEKINNLQKQLDFENDFFDFNSFLDANERRLVGFLDLFFYDLLGSFNPNSDDDFEQGIVTYTLYDAACPFIGDNPYDLKDKEQFTKYIFDTLNEKSV